MEPLEIRFSATSESKSLHGKIGSSSPLKEAVDNLVTMIREMRACEGTVILMSSSILEPITQGVMRSGTHQHQWLIDDLTHVGAIRISFSQPDRVSGSIRIVIKPENVGWPPNGFSAAEFTLTGHHLPKIDLHRICFAERWYS